MNMSGALRESKGPDRVEIHDIPKFGNDFEFQISGVLDENLFLNLLSEGCDLPEDVILTGNKCWLNAFLLVFAVNGVQFSPDQAEYLFDLIRRSNDVQQNPAVLDIARALGTTSFEWVLYEVIVSANTCINLTELNSGPPVYIINNATGDGQIDSHWYVVLPEGSPLVTRFSAVSRPIVRDDRGSREARAARTPPVAQGKGSARVPHEARKAREQEARKAREQEARKASDEAATQAFLQREARDEARDEAVQKRAVDSWIRWHAAREASEQEARKASDEAATQAFIQREARDDAATMSLIRQLVQADEQTLADSTLARRMAAVNA